MVVFNHKIVRLFMAFDLELFLGELDKIWVRNDLSFIMSKLIIPKEYQDEGS